MTTDIVRVNPGDIVTPNAEHASAALAHYLTTGDVARLDGAPLLALYFEICRSISINPRTRPLDLIEFWDPETKAKKLTLYPTHQCADQLAYLHRIRIETLDERIVGTLFKVALRGTMPDGRVEENVAYLDLTDRDGKQLRGQKLGNAYMKTRTKAKRRLVLGMTGFNIPGAAEAIEQGRKVYLDGLGHILEHPTEEQRHLADHPEVARAIGAPTWEDQDLPETGLEAEPVLPVRPDPGPPPRTGPRPTFKNDPEQVRRWLGAWFAAVKGSSLDDDHARARYVTQWTAGLDGWPEAKQTDSLRTFFARATAAEAVDLLAHTTAVVEGERQAAAEAAEHGVAEDGAARGAALPSHQAAPGTTAPPLFDDEPEAEPF
jgi:hypothetical protein